MPLDCCLWDYQLLIFVVWFYRCMQIIWNCDNVFFICCECFFLILFSLIINHSLFCDCLEIKNVVLLTQISWQRLNMKSSDLVLNNVYFYWHYRFLMKIHCIFLMKIHCKFLMKIYWLQLVCYISKTWLTWSGSLLYFN